MTSQMPTLEEIEAVLSMQLPNFAPVTLKDLVIPIEGITAKYFVDGNRVKVQLFCEGDQFPIGFQSALKEMISMVKTMPPPPVVEYVPEAKSWYFEFTPSPIMVVETILPLFTKRLANLVKAHVDGSVK